ncbi:glycosyltransferase family 2 protein [Leadbettera azotonutricia]|uniref:Beta-1,4-galactosyltransferase n=1 Tax=Leadbettera azotonutricia (strain ATCC BAA-888 / DSM 13862 / ZAS-9) TaxID=545695 RepID=F5YAV9_LEAAZ|nr:glycosyltransferase family 2 protein [Leadbettera azotonutricia]AEF82355.1 beta-1,4-galactosyltransferase [Leadbettera azotonutricia ZAS-9]
MKLLSIIIPVYNVKPYLIRCLESIINQTYKNLDIIIVDDSTDGSAEICDEYEKKDNRITIIHKNRSGVADARNAGLAIAKGEIIGFVDADDWIDTDMYEVLIDNYNRTGADIVMCGCYYAYDTVFFKNNNDEFFNIDILLNREMALDLLLYDSKIKNHVWDKIYNKKLFSNCLFPAGEFFFEDTTIMYKLFLQINMISVVSNYKYYYFQRNDSGVRIKTLQAEIRKVNAYYERYEELKHCTFVDQELLFLKTLNIIFEFYIMFPFNLRKENKMFLLLSEKKNNYNNIRLRDNLLIHIPRIQFIFIIVLITWSLYLFLKKIIKKFR